MSAPRGTGGAGTHPAAPASPGTVDLVVEETGVATIRISRPAKLNALTLEMLGELDDALARLRSSEARVVLVRSDGDRAFCVGADVRQFSTLGALGMWRRWVAEGHRTFDQLARLPQPTVAVLDGAALGGGLELALCCDFRLAVTGARLGLPETGIGTVPGWGGVERLTRLVGEARAKEMVLAGRQVPAERAEAWGLVTSVHRAGDLDAAVDELVGELLGAAPTAQQVAKQLIHAAAPPQGTSAVLEALASGFTAGTGDFTEGVTAFAERRPPRFSAR